MSTIDENGAHHGIDGRFQHKNHPEDTHVRLDQQTFFPPSPLTERDRQVLADCKGIFGDGYTDDDINRVLSRFESARLTCVWDTHDDGYGGGSEIFGVAMGSRASGPFGVGQAIPAAMGSYRTLDPGVWSYLHDNDSDIDPHQLTSLLSDEVFDGGDPDRDMSELYGDGSHNVAVEHTETEECAAGDCDERPTVVTATRPTVTGTGRNVPDHPKEVNP